MELVKSINSMLLLCPFFNCSALDIIEFVAVPVDRSQITSTQYSHTWHDPHVHRSPDLFILIAVRSGRAQKRRIYLRWPEIPVTWTAEGTHKLIPVANGNVYIPCNSPSSSSSSDRDSQRTTAKLYYQCIGVVVGAVLLGQGSRPSTKSP